MPRITLVFALSGPQTQQNLLHEFSLHHDVVATGTDHPDGAAIRVETSDVPGAIWEVRATVGLFDDRAAEISDQV